MHVRIRLNSFVLRAARTTFATAVLGATAAACCAGVSDPDTQLQVELTEDAEVEAAEGEAAQARVCGAEVIAVNGDERIPLDEVALDDGGCVYRAEGVDPEVVYDIEASHPELGNGNDATTSNPSCSSRTDPDTTDIAFNLRAVSGEQLEELPSLEEGEQMTADL